MFHQLILASHNPAKKKRYQKTLPDITILSLKDLNITQKAPETGVSAEENAQMKAKFYFNLIHKPVLAEDEALYVDFLSQERQPGVHVRRINGTDEASDDELLSYWEDLLKDIPLKKRTGKWHFAYAIQLSSDTVETFSVDYPYQFFSPTSSIRLPGYPMSSIGGSPLVGKPHSEYTSEDHKLVDAQTEEILRERITTLLDF